MNWFVELLDDLISEGSEFKPEKIEELREARARLAHEGISVRRKQVTDRLVVDIDEADTIDRLAAIFATIPREYGFDHATLMVLKEGRTCLSRRVISTLPDDWWTDYHAKNLSEEDPIVSGILECEHELYLDELIPKNDAPMRYLKCAEAHNIGCNGVISKVAYPSGLVVALVLNTVKQPDYVRRQFRKYRDDLHTLTETVCDALVYLSRLGSNDEEALTSDEIRFLRLVAKSEDPASALAMHTRYGSASNIQNQVMRKLGVSSIFQAVFVAVHKGYLDGGMLYPEDIIGTRPKINGWDLLTPSDTGAVENQCTSDGDEPPRETA
jgi:hypothetical protein